MKRRALAVFLAGAVAAAVLLWSASPAWRTPGTAAAFAADGTRLFVQRPTDEAIRLVTLDAATGRELADVDLRDLDRPIRGGRVQASPDGRRVAVVQQAKRWSDKPAAWALYDGATGARVTPTGCDDWTLHVAFSPGGRWIAVAATLYDQDERFDRLTLIDAATGLPLGPPLADDRRPPRAFRFRADDAAVAWVTERWVFDGIDHRLWQAEVLALPSLASLGQVDLGGFGPTLVAFRGDRLTASRTRVPWGSGEDYRTFDVTRPGAGVSEPHLSNADGSRVAWAATSAGPWLVGRRRSRTRAFPSTLLAWGGRRGWWRHAAPEGDDVQMSLIDPATGAGTGLVAAWLPGEADLIPSPDGRLVAASRDGAVTLWQVERPWPRGAVALIVAGAVLAAAAGGLPRRRERDTVERVGASAAGQDRTP